MKVSIVTALATLLFCVSTAVAQTPPPPPGLNFPGIGDPAATQPAPAPVERSVGDGVGVRLATPILTHKSAQKGVSQKGCTACQKGIAQKGIAQKGIAQKGIAQKQSGVLPCVGCDVCSSCWTADIEATFLRFHRADGYNTDNVFGFEISPRVSVAYHGADGLGFRVRWWDYNHANNDGAVRHSVDTYNIDLELFEEVELTCNTRVEVSGGLRYNDFSHVGSVAGAETDSFSAFGGMIGIKARRDTCNGTLYVGLREVIMMSDWSDNGANRFDVTRSVTEIASGFETTRCMSNGTLLTLNVGVELQQWANYIEGRTDDGEPVDIGFGGFVLGASLNF